MQIIWRFQKVFRLIESFYIGKSLRIVLKHNSPSEYAINVGIHQNFLPDVP